MAEGGARTAVVVPVRNGERWIAEAVASALAQTDRDLAVVVVDDGSSDGTAGVVEEAARRDARVRLLRRAAGGPGAARNAGVAATTARFLCFLDADDLLAPQALERRHEALAHDPHAALAYGDTRVVREADEGEVRVQRPPRDGAEMAALLRRGGECFYPHAALVRREWFERVGGFGEAVEDIEDVVLWTRVALAGGRFVHAAAPPNVYRLRPGSRSHDPLYATDARVRLLRLLRATDLTTDERRTVGDRLRSLLLLRAAVRSSRGDAAGARRDALDSLRLARRAGHVREGIACALAPRRTERFLRHLPEHVRAEL